MPETRFYLLRDIPPGLWPKVREKAYAQNLTLRSVVLSLLQEWADPDVGNPPSTSDRVTSKRMKDVERPKGGARTIVPDAGIEDVPDLF